MIKAIKIKNNDNVATLIGNVKANGLVNIFNNDGSSYEIKAKEKILFGHKISIKKIYTLTDKAHDAVHLILYDSHPRSPEFKKIISLLKGS